MKKLVLMAFAMFSLTACEKEVLPEGGIDIENVDLATGSAKLNIFARASGDAENGTITEGKVYIFNNDGLCVQVLTMDEESQQFATQLAAGRYTLYAIGGDDLTRFALPTQGEAAPNSVITRLPGKVMDDLMMASAVVDLEDEEPLNQNMILEHKVVCIDNIEIREVPLTATKVEMTFSPLHSAVCLNGTFPATPTESYMIALTKQADGTTWKAEPDQMLFPSKGSPAVNVLITTSTGTLSYSYTAAEMVANHHFNIVGTYQVSQGVSLSGTLTAGDWGEDQTITFDMDESDMEVVYFPVAGTFYNGYYVVSVDVPNRTAVLLAKEKLDYTVPGSNASNVQWKAALVSPMAALEKPTGVTNAWRLPTLAEVDIFARDTQVTYFGETSGNTPNFYCLDGEERLNWAYMHRDNDVYELHYGYSGFVDRIHLRPVIEVNF